jgi:endonuclease-3
VRDAYQLLLWEQVAYLADDAKRNEAYRLLGESIGTKPMEILGATDSALRAVTRRGGAIAVAQRADRLRAVARRVWDVWNGSLRSAVRLPFPKARRELARYPSIGEPGAERILLLSGAYAVLGLDSNALRVLLRLGYGREFPQWAKTYKAVQAAAEDELPRTIASRRSAYLLLRHHGQELCRRSAPRCLQCPLRPDCPTGRGRSA